MDVQFHEEDPIVLKRPVVARAKKVSFLTNLAIKLKLAKDEAQAQQLMLIAALMCFAAALVLALNLSGVI